MINSEINVVGYESRFDERARENTLEKVVAQEGVRLYGAPVAGFLEL